MLWRGRQDRRSGDGRSGTRSWRQEVPSAAAVSNSLIRAFSDKIESAALCAAVILRCEQSSRLAACEPRRMAAAHRYLIRCDARPGRRPLISGLPEIRIKGAQVSQSRLAMARRPRRPGELLSVTAKVSRPGAIISWSTLSANALKARSTLPGLQVGLRGAQRLAVAARRFSAAYGAAACAGAKMLRGDATGGPAAAVA